MQKSLIGKVLFELANFHSLQAITAADARFMLIFSNDDPAVVEKHAQKFPDRRAVVEGRYELLYERSVAQLSMTQNFVSAYKQARTLCGRNRQQTVLLLDLHSKQGYLIDECGNLAYIGDARVRAETCDEYILSDIAQEALDGAEDCSVFTVQDEQNPMHYTVYRLDFTK